LSPPYFPLRLASGASVWFSPAQPSTIARHQTAEERIPVNHAAPRLFGPLVLAILLPATACGGGKKEAAPETTTGPAAGGGTATIAAPASIKNAGTLRFCTDIT
jgi:hypothetical protein